MVGLVVQFDLDDVAGSGWSVPWSGDDAVRETGRDDDGRRGLVIVHLLAGGSRIVGRWSAITKFGQVFGLEQFHQCIAQLLAILVDQSRPGYWLMPLAEPPKSPGDEPQAEGQQERRQQHEDQGGLVAEDKFEIFETDEE